MIERGKRKVFDASTVAVWWAACQSITVLRQQLMAVLDKEPVQTELADVLFERLGDAITQLSEHAEDMKTYFELQEEVGFCA